MFKELSYNTPVQIVPFENGFIGVTKLPHKDQYAILKRDPKIQGIIFDIGRNGTKKYYFILNGPTIESVETAPENEMYFISFATKNLNLPFVQQIDLSFEKYIMGIVKGACEEQRELCLENARVDSDLEIDVDPDSILNAPLPKIIKDFYD